MQTPKIKLLHEAVVDTVSKVKEIHESHAAIINEPLTIGEKLADMVFNIVSNWVSIFLFALLITGWIIYNTTAAAKYRFDPFPFSLMTFVLAGIAAIQAPVMMITLHRENLKQNKPIALNLKVENEVLTLHQSITVLIEEQLQQVHKNQLITNQLLEALQLNGARERP